MHDKFLRNLPDHVDVSLSNVSVHYRMPSDQVRTFKEHAINFLRGKREKKTLLALDDIDLEINRGEIFGILGKNGAGKSTLLKVISRVLIPSEGRVIIRGMISPMLSLGAGFHPELTGRENIYLNGTLLGHSHLEIDQKFDEIVKFSEIPSFIDSPIRTYSSGMQARLGFAVASAWPPEILVLDEVLSVGDIAFQQKCINRIKSYREREINTIILVTHRPEQVASICTRAMWLDLGKIKAIGDPNKISEQYIDWMNTLVK